MMYFAAVEVVFPAGDTDSEGTGTLEFPAIGRAPAGRYEVAWLQAYYTGYLLEGGALAIRDLSLVAGVAIVSHLATSGPGVLVPMAAEIPSGWDGRIAVSFHRTAGAFADPTIEIPITIAVAVRAIPAAEAALRPPACRTTVRGDR